MDVKCCNCDKVIKIKDVVVSTSSFTDKIFNSTENKHKCFKCFSVKSTTSIPISTYKHEKNKMPDFPSWPKSDDDSDEVFYSSKKKNRCGF